MKDIAVRKNNWIYLSCSLFLMACSNNPSVLNDAEYLKWIENPENGASVIKQISDFEFAVIYKPLDYLVALECNGKNIPGDSIIKRKNELKGYQYYTFRIRSLKDNEFFRTGLHSENEYYERLEYFVSDAQNDISLVEGKDTISCAVYHFERGYGVSPYTNIVLSFEEKDSLNITDKVFIYDDKILGVGKIAIKISADEINELPKLNI